MKPDEQPGAPQLSPSLGLLGPVLPAFKASADGRRQPHIFAKTRSVFPEIPLISLLSMLRHLSSKSLTSFPRLPYQGLESRQHGSRRFNLKVNVSSLQRTQGTETTRYVDRRNTRALSYTGWHVRVKLLHHIIFSNSRK